MRLYSEAFNLKNFSNKFNMNKIKTFIINIVKVKPIAITSLKNPIKTMKTMNKKNNNNNNNDNDNFLFFSLLLFDYLK